MLSGVFEEISQVSFGIDAVEPGGVDQRVEPRSGVAARVGANKQPIFSPNRQWPRRWAGPARSNGRASSPSRSGRDRRPRAGKSPLAGREAGAVLRLGPDEPTPLQPHGELHQKRAGINHAVRGRTGPLVQIGATRDLSRVSPDPGGPLTQWTARNSLIQSALKGECFSATRLLEIERIVR
jgi:hypothetical protein